MKCRGIALLLGSVLCTAVVAQNPESDDLPSAPSAVQQERSKPKPPPPAASKTNSTSQSSNSSASSDTQTPVSSDPSAAKSEPPQSAAKSESKSDTTSNQADDASTTITKTVNEVNVVFTVTDKHGRYVKNLAKNDFAVLDDS